MGKQYNKLIKRRRRSAYLARRKAALSQANPKAKKASKAKPKAEEKNDDVFDFEEEDDDLF